MVTQNNDIEALIAVFLSGEATPEQAIEVQEFIQKSPENKKYFLELEKTYSITHSKDTFDPTSKNKVWNAITNSTDIKKAIVIRFPRMKWMYAAASLLIFGTVATYFLLTNHGIKPKISKRNNPKGVIENQVILAKQHDKNVTLSDKSFVKLAKGSEIHLDKDFDVKNRHLSLKGSAEFTVVHNEKKPFVVSVGKLKIVDIGTIFRVESNADTVKIVVDEGKVELRLNNSIINMSAGDSAFYVIKSDFIGRYETKKQRKDKVFEFDGTSLKEVTEILSEFFEKEIIIKNKEIEDCPLTVRFKNEDLITILDLIKELMDIKVVKNNHVIELYGKGCN